MPPDSNNNFCIHLYLENLKAFIVPVVYSLPCKDDHILPDGSFTLGFLILKHTDELCLLGDTSVLLRELQVSEQNLS